MDDIAKHVSSFQLDQEILDARGITMTVAEVAGLSTARYSEKVQSLRLNEADNAFLKGLRRRIKNRLASQNSRRRSSEQLRQLARELRVVRRCKGDAASERRGLLQRRRAARDRCAALTEYVMQVLKERQDTSQIPTELLLAEEMATQGATESQKPRMPVKNPVPPPPAPPVPDIARDITKDIARDQMTQGKLFECRVDKLVQQSVTHIYKADTDKKIVSAKTVFISNGDTPQSNLEGGFKDAYSEEGVLNLSVKGGRRNHGRKQSAPRRVVYAFCDNDESVLDLKIKKGH